MSDTWTEIQEHKRRQDILRDRLQRRRRERQGIGGQENDLSGLLSPIYLYVMVCNQALISRENKKTSRKGLISSTPKYFRVDSLFSSLYALIGF